MKPVEKFFARPIHPPEKQQNTARLRLRFICTSSPSFVQSSVKFPRLICPALDKTPQLSVNITKSDFARGACCALVRYPHIRKSKPPSQPFKTPLRGFSLPTPPRV